MARPRPWAPPVTSTDWSVNRSGIEVLLLVEKAREMSGDVGGVPVRLEVVQLAGERDAGAFGRAVQQPLETGLRCSGHLGEFVGDAEGDGREVLERGHGVHPPRREESLSG